MRPIARFMYGLLWLFAAVAVLPASSPKVVAGESFGLREAFLSIMSRNPAISGKQAEVDAKEYAGDSARAQRYPTLSAQAGMMDNNEKTYVLRARQPVWAFGRIDSAIDYADADFEAEQADFLRVKRNLLEKTAVAFARVHGILKRKEIEERNVAKHEKFYGQIMRREAGQLASRADVKLAASRLIQARAQLKRMEGELQMAMTELESLTRVDIESVAPVDDRFLDLPATAEVEGLAVKNSAEMHYKLRMVKLAEANTDVQETSSFPTVYMQADRSFNTVGLQGRDYRYGLVVEGNLDGMGLAAVGKARSATARERAAKLDYEVARVELIRDVRTLLSNREIQGELVKVQKESVNEFEGMLESFVRQYEAGRKNWLDVLNIQRELTDQQLQQAQAENDWRIYSLKLKVLIGDFDQLTDGEELAE